MLNKEIKALLKLMEGTDIEELEVQRAGIRIRIRRRGAGGEINTVVRESQVTASGGEAAAGALVPGREHLVTIESPMVGTFYRAPNPGVDPYVREGDFVEKGTVLCIIEAMKLMNEIEAEVPGRVISILVESGQPVEFGQPLFLLEPR